MRNNNANLSKQWVENDSFYSKKILQNEVLLQKDGEKKALQLFHKAAEHVPAYKKFLKKHHINPHTISSYNEFQKVPFTDKKNYLDIYPFEELVWNGKISNNFVISSSSGTTGRPYYWPLSL